MGEGGTPEGATDPSTCPGDPTDHNTLVSGRGRWVGFSGGGFWIWWGVDRCVLFHPFSLLACLLFILAWESCFGVVLFFFSKKRFLLRLFVGY